MTEFRDAHLRCPSCPEGRLESHLRDQHRCGTCNGRWMPFDELARTMDAVTGWSADATICAETQGERTCPACVAKMSTFRLRTAAIQQRYGRSQIALDRCAHHGVWLDGGELEALVAETTLALGKLRDETEMFRPFRWVIAKLRGHD